MLTTFRPYRVGFILEAVRVAVGMDDSSLETAAFKALVIKGAKEELERRSKELREMESLVERMKGSLDYMRMPLSWLREDVRELREGLADLL